MSTVLRTKEHIVSKFPRKTGVVILIFVILISSGVLILGQQPLHRTSIEHSDVEGDMIDQDIDIIEIKSFLQGENLVLQLKVTGIIHSISSSDPDDSSEYQYRLIVVAKGLEDDDAHIYVCSYIYGIISQYDFEAEAENDTLVIYFPLSAFVFNSYMIGLEGRALVTGNNGIEVDYTQEDRTGPINRWLF
ncbi:MAG: hypothetical protein ACXAEN_20065 [Candidatus Thorarchaeota archaeon]|jgi:hypothetical protein